MQINNTNPNAQLGVFKGAEGAPVETGGFDFFSYLLGLNQNPQDNTFNLLDSENSSENASNLPDEIFVPQEKSEEKSSVLSGKEDQSLWNMFLPTQNLAPVENKMPNPANGRNGSNFLEQTSVQPDRMNALPTKPAEKVILTADELSQISQKLSGLFSNDATDSLKSSNSAERLNSETDSLDSEGSDLPISDEPTLPQTVDASSKKMEAKKADPNLALEEPKPSFARKQEKSVGDQDFAKVDSEANKSETVTKEKPIQSSLKVRKEDSSDGRAINLNGAPQVSLTAHSNPNLSNGKTGAEQRLEIPELMNRISTSAQKGGGTMTVSLNPQHLGELEVTVTTRGKKVDIELRSGSDVAKSLLESHLGQLKQSLQNHDLTVSRLEVQVTRDADRALSGEAFMQQQQNFQQFQSQQQSGGREESRWLRGTELSGSSRPNQLVQNSGIYRPATSVAGRVDLRI